MGEAKRRKLAGIGPRGKPFNPQDYAGRSFGSVLEELGPRPGGGWEWTQVAFDHGTLVYCFAHPEHPGIEWIIGGTVALEFYRLKSESSPLDPGEDRFDTLAAALDARGEIVSIGI